MKRTGYFLLLLMLVCASSGLLFALMPPHVSGKPVVRASEGLVVFHGYSLKYAGENSLEVYDATSGKKALYSEKLSCVWINNCSDKRKDLPGCSQQKCTLEIRLKNPARGHRYRIGFLKESVSFTLPKQ